ncbi:hypothetical protein TNCV_1005431 [Trichonephila clavipes]|nr:hypothetical protein TNCV_1005431 [Trichonephila clavipes]
MFKCKLKDSIKTNKKPHVPQETLHLVKKMQVVPPSIVPSGNFAELNRTVPCRVPSVLLDPCHDEFRGPRSDYVRQHLIPSATFRRFINSKASRRSCIIMPPKRRAIGRSTPPSTKEKSITSLRIRRATSIKAGKSSSTRHWRSAFV